MVSLMHSLFPFSNYHRRCDPGKVGFHCRNLEFFLNQSFRCGLERFSKASHDMFDYTSYFVTVGLSNTI